MADVFTRMCQERRRRLTDQANRGKPCKSSDAPSPERALGHGGPSRVDVGSVITPRLGAPAPKDGCSELRGRGGTGGFYQGANPCRPAGRVKRPPQLRLAPRTGGGADYPGPPPSSGCGGRQAPRRACGRYLAFEWSGHVFRNRFSGRCGGLGVRRRAAWESHPDTAGPRPRIGAAGIASGQT